MKTALYLALSTSLCLAADRKLGKPLTLPHATSIAQVLANPAPLVGKTVQVKGRVTEVCQMMGCWMALADLDSKAVLRVKVNDGEIVFPTDSIGKMAVAEGKLTRMDLTRDQAVARAKHEAEERTGPGSDGRKFDPKSIRGPDSIYQIQAAGAVITE